METSTENPKIQATLKTLNDLKSKIENLLSKEKIHEIQSTISTSIEETHAAVGNRIDAEMKKTLKGTMQILNGAKSELEGIQKKILKLMGGTKKPAKKSAKKTVSRKTKSKAKSRKA
jgi:phage-related protein